jgi:hypothetical protein
LRRSSRASTVAEPTSTNRLEDAPHGGGLVLVHHEFAVLHIVPERDIAAHPHPLHAGGADLVADALGRDLPLELREAEQDIQRQPPHGRGGVEGLRDRHESHAVAVEDLDQLREVHEGSRQAVDLVDHDDINQAVFDVGQKLLEAGAVQRPARDAAVVILIADQHPTLGALAGDIRLAGLSLGVERVELLLQPFLGRLARVDGAALAADGICALLHQSFPRFRSRNPKKR